MRRSSEIMFIRCIPCCPSTGCSAFCVTASALLIFASSIPSPVAVDEPSVPSALRKHSGEAEVLQRPYNMLIARLTLLATTRGTSLLCGGGKWSNKTWHTSTDMYGDLDTHLQMSIVKTLTHRFFVFWHHCAIGAAWSLLPTVAAAQPRL